MYGQQYGQYGQQRPSFLQAQPTGFAPGGIQPQQTGYPMQPQQTGYPMQQQQTGFQQQQNYGAMPPMPALPAQFQQQRQFNPPVARQMPMQTGYPGMQQQQQSGFGNMGMSNALQHVPQMFTQTFLPANPTMAYNPAQPQFAQPSALGGQSLQQVYSQQLAQPQVQQTQGPLPWALTADERKNYDAIFRAWDQQGTGFITGNLAKEVFGQSGIATDDLMQIWNLADTENRGKLNLAEFHVAMGLIFRRLNGNTIPAQLPPELVPPSSRDLGHSVDFLKDLLRSDTNNRYTADPESASNSYAKARTLHGAAAPNPRQDATVYKHDDSSAARQTYKSSSRHLDRKTVRAAGDDSNASDLADIRRQLDSSQSLLDSSRDKDAADEALAQEKDDLMYNIKRIQSDIEHNSRGRRTEAKESERRRLDRELDRLKYESLPELERKIEEREREKDRDRRRNASDRDRRNDRYARYEPERSTRDRPSADGDRSDGDSEERGYLRGTFTDNRVPSPAPIRREEPPPPPPAQAELPPPPAAPSKPVMSDAERKEFVKAEAARRVQERLRALGIGGDAAPVVDAEVQQRVEAEKQEAAAKSASADQEAAERQKQRQLKLEREKLKEGDSEIKQVQAAAAKISTVSDDITKSEMQTPPSNPVQAAAVEGAREQVDKEEAEIARREQELAEQKRKRLERIKQLEAEEAEEARRAEKNFKQKKERFGSAPKPPKPPAPVRPTRKGPPAVPTPAEPVVAAPAIPPAPAQPASSTNPFHRNQPVANETSAAAAQQNVATAALGPNNPFNRNRAAPSSAPARVATPPRPKTPVVASTEDWDIPIEKDQPDDSDSDSDSGGRENRRRLADQIFGGIMPGSNISRPSSAQASSAPPPVPSAPIPPPPSMRPPTAPVAPQIASSPISAPPRGALLGEIQAGARLKKAVTKDKSGPAVSGAVIGDAAPPSHIGNSTDALDKRQSVDWYGGLASDSLQRSTSEPPNLTSHVEEDEEEEQFHEAPSFTERVTEGVASAAKSVLSAVGLGSSEGHIENVNTDRPTRARTVYAYSNPSKEDDLTVEENAVLTTYPALDNEDWVYGKLSSGKAGWLPAGYIAPLESGATYRAIYDYTASSSEEADLTEGTTYEIVDRSDADWFKIEDGNRIKLVPSLYLEEAVFDLRSSDQEGGFVDSDSEDEETSAQNESRRLRMLAESGILTKNKRKPPPPPLLGRNASTAPVIHEVKVDVDDAYERWTKLQRDLPPLPTSSTRDSLTIPLSPEVELLSASPNLSKSATGGFFSRLTSGIARSTPSPNHERLSTANIVRTGSSMGSASMEFSPGLTWSSLIDPSALEAMPEKERKRQESMFEFVATESAYVQNLQLVVSEFIAKIGPSLDDKLNDIIFANIEDILIFNTTLHSELEERQRESRLYIEEIGDILAKHFNGLDVYRPYCINQDSARRTLEDIKAGDSEAATLLKTLRVNDLELEHFLLQPMQRLTRYPLLVGQIMRYTDDAGSLESLKKCRKIAEAVLSATNEAIRENEDEVRLGELSEKLAVTDELQLDLTLPTSSGQKRRILKDGQLGKRRSTKKLHAWLFSDMLLLVDENCVAYRSPIPLHELSITDHRDDECFSISHLGVTTVYKTSSARQAHDWIKALESGREQRIWSMQTGR